METFVTRMLIPVYQLGRAHADRTAPFFMSLLCFLNTLFLPALSWTGIIIMTGNDVSALLLGLMGTHKSARSLCSLVLVRS